MESKKMFFTAIVSASILLTANICLAEEDSVSWGVSFSTANAGQNQDQVYDGFSRGSSRNGMTTHDGAQDQRAWGNTSGESNVSTNQYEEQTHGYSLLKGGRNNWTGQEGESFMSSGMTGDSRSYDNENSFEVSGSQVYRARIGSHNHGSGSAFSSMEDGFTQATGSSSSEGSSVTSWTNLSANNSYAQLATRGNDWVFQSGDSFSNSNLIGNSQGGFNGGFVSGNQYGGTLTNQSNNGTFQQGSQFASVNIGVGEIAFGNASIGYRAEMGQTHSYQQYNQGRNGYQYQNGTITTNVVVSRGENIE